MKHSKTFECGGLRGGIYRGEPAHWRKHRKLRACDKCGGLHRRDVERLLREGAYWEPSNKSHKAYLGNHGELNALPGAAKYYYWHPDEADGGPLEILSELVRSPNPYLFVLPEFVDTIKAIPHP